MHRRLLYEFALGPWATVERSTIRERRTESGDVFVDNLNTDADGNPQEDCKQQIVTHLFVFTDCLCFVDRRNVNVPVIKGSVRYPPDSMEASHANSADTARSTRVTFTTDIPPPDSVQVPKWTWEVRRAFVLC